jgi:two-component system sensor histidine kinase QseC
MVLPLAEAQGRALRIELPDMLPVAGDADDLRDALRNLLENAVLHGAGEIGVAAIYRDGGVLVAVTDQGAGVQKGQEEAVFDRFRKDRASAGTGLGLAIVREVARRHGGRVGFVPGDVCRVEFWLPGGEANKAGFG